MTGGAVFVETRLQVLNAFLEGFDDGQEQITIFSGFSRARAMSSSRFSMTEVLPKSWGQRIEVDVFDGLRECGETVLPPSPLGLAHGNPIGGAVAGTPKTIFFNEGFGQVNRVTVMLLPVCGQSPQNSSQ